MPNINNAGTRIYYQYEGQGEPLVLLHGLSDSQWGLRALGYVELLKPHFRVILMDMRGHGYSDKPHDPAAYALEQLTSDVLSVLDLLQIQRTHLFGYSLGGWIGLGVACTAPDRIFSMTIGGAHPYATDFSFFRNAFAQGIDAWIASIEHHHGPLAHNVRQYLHNNDSRALQALVMHDRPAIWQTGSSHTVPTLFFAGRYDPLYPSIKRAANSSSVASFCEIEGMNHYTLYQRSDLVVPLVLKNSNQLATI